MRAIVNGACQITERHRSRPERRPPRDRAAAHASAPRIPSRSSRQWGLPPARRAPVGRWAAASGGAYQWESARRSHVTIGTDIQAPCKGAGTAQADATAREDIANLKTDLAYLQQQVHGLGVTGRFVRNCTLSGKGKNFNGLHKRSFSNGSACPRISGRSGFHKPVPKSRRKAIGVCNARGSASVRVMGRLSVRFFTNRAVTPRTPSPRLTGQHPPDGPLPTNLLARRGCVRQRVRMHDRGHHGHHPGHGRGPLAHVPPDR